jgi:RimJ/RimL family protein N-acetyltransferase
LSRVCWPIKRWRWLIKARSSRTCSGGTRTAGIIHPHRQQFGQGHRIFLDGVSSKKQYLLSIEESDTGVKIGLIWFAEKYQASRPSAFIYDFLIYEEHRRKGYGKQALIALEENVKELGIETIGLHVFAHNQAAIDLYQKTGYKMTNIRMAKKLSA